MKTENFSGALSRTQTCMHRNQATAGIPVVAITASVMNDQQQEAMTAGFDAFERKPISVLGLLQTVRRLLAQ